MKIKSGETGFVYLWVVITTCLLVTLLIFNHNAEKSGHRKSGIGTKSDHLPDFSAIESTKAKKQAFFEYLRPFIRLENRRIMYDRAFLESIRANFNNIPSHGGVQLRKLGKLAAKYHYEIRDPALACGELSKRIDIIPESLVLAQAANESAWGTSRFATQANNLFGQWCYTKNCGLIPLHREPTAKNEVKRFSSPQDSVVSYMKNLNTHLAYKEFRSIRANLRESDKTISGQRLAYGLINYSQRREKYVKEIVQMIRQNHLE